MNYHAHVYFWPDQLLYAQKLYQQAQALHGTIFSVWRFYKAQVGPHHLPMFEIHFEESNKDKVVTWLETHRKDLSVLIHQNTGDDVTDHQETVLWLGEILPISFEFFHLVKADPTKAVHAPSKK